MIRRLVLLLGFAAQAACSNGLAGAPHTAAGAVTRDHSVIDAADMEPLQVANLYEAVEKLHPEWIRGRQTNRASRDRDGQILADVTPRRYFCTACHVQQTDARPLVPNTFTDMLATPRAPR